MSLKLRRGLETQRTGITPAEGEIIYTTDSKRLYVGDGLTAGGNSVSAPVTSVNSQTGAVTLTTSNIPEVVGSSNLYFTTERAQDSVRDLLNAGTHTGISFDYQDNTNALNATVNQLFVEEIAQDAAAQLFTNGSHSSNITFSYHDNTNTIDVNCTAANDTFKTIETYPKIYFTDLVAGSNYTHTPTVTINRGIGDTTGTGATAQAFLIPASIASIAITNAGSGYLTPPTLQFTGGGDQSSISHATATCTVSGGQISTISITYQGLGYTSTPTIVVTGTSGSNAVLTPALNPTGIAKIELVANGSNYTADPSVSITRNAYDSTGSGASVVGHLSAARVASGANDSLTIAGGNGINVVINDQNNIVISSKNTFDIAPGTANNIAFYPNDSNKIAGAKGIAWLDDLGTFQIGSQSQGVNGNLRIVRNDYTTTPGKGVNFEQYHTVQDTVNVNFIRGRGTQNSPAAVQNLDKLADLSFAGHDGTNTVFGGQITARVDGIPTTGKMPVRLEFYTRNTTDNIAALALTLYGDKTATFASTVNATGFRASNATVRLANLTTSQRDALSPALGDMIYNLDTNKFQGYAVSGWVDLS